MPVLPSNDPTALKKLANHALVMHLLNLIDLHLKKLFTEEIEFHPFGQGPFLYKMSQELWRICRGTREHKSCLLNTDRVITDITNYVDTCAQRAECGYFWRAEFVNEMVFMSTRLRALLDFQ